MLTSCPVCGLMSLCPVLSLPLSLCACEHRSSVPLTLTSERDNRMECLLHTHMCFRSWSCFHTAWMSLIPTLESTLISPHDELHLYSLSLYLKGCEEACCLISHAWTPMSDRCSRRTFTPSSRSGLRRDIARDILYGMWLPCHRV